MIDEILELKALAQLAYSLKAPSREFDGRMFKALFESTGQQWSRDVGEAGVWHCRTAGHHGTWQAPPFYSESLDALTALRQPGMRIIALREHAFMGLVVTPGTPAFSCTLSVDGSLIAGYGSNLAYAFAHALLQALRDRAIAEVTNEQTRPSMYRPIPNTRM